MNFVQYDFSSFGLDFLFILHQTYWAYVSVWGKFLSFISDASPTLLPECRQEFSSGLLYLGLLDDLLEM